MKKSKKVIMIASIISLLGAGTAFAEDQYTNKSFLGEQVYCQLSVDWSTFGKDYAAAYTTWDHDTHVDSQLGTRIYYKDSKKDSYHFGKSDWSTFQTIAKFNRSGVWTYRSNHFGENFESNDVRELKVFYDW